MRGNAVAHAVHLLVCIVLVLIHHSHVVGCRLCLSCEERHDGLRGIIVHIILVEAVERRRLRGCGDADVAQTFAREHALEHRLVALQILADECLGIFVRPVFGFHLIMTVADIRLQIE